MTQDVNQILNNIINRALRRQGINQIPINAPPVVPEVTVSPSDVGVAMYGKAFPYLGWGSLIAPIISGIIASIQARRAGVNPYAVAGAAIGGMTQPTQTLTQTIMQKMAELQKQKMVADALKKKAEEDEKEFQRQLQKLQEQFKLQKQLLKEEYKLKQPRTQAEIERIKSQAESYKALAETRRQASRADTSIQQTAFKQADKLWDDVMDAIDLIRKIEQNPNDPTVRARLSGVAEKYGIDVNTANVQQLRDLANALLYYRIQTYNTFAQKAGIKPFKIPESGDTSTILPPTLEGFVNWVSGGNK